MPLQEQKLTGLKKREQIKNANKTMFVWVAVASVALSFFLVAAQFLYQQWSYNNSVLAAKSKAVSVLNSNITNSKALIQNVNALVGDQNLASMKTSPEDTNTKVILDALPSKLDTTALATSLQAIVAHSGVAIETIDVPGLGQASDSQDSKPIEQKFVITAGGTYDRIRGMVVDLERSIRPMKITSIKLTGSDTAMRATVEGVTYYQPSRTISIKQQVVK
jgi:hypothetical protein